MSGNRTIGGHHIYTGLTYFIRFLVKFPKLLILISLFVAFNVGYSVNYDFTMMKVNLYINNQYFASSVPSQNAHLPTNIIGFKNKVKYDYDYKQVKSMSTSNLKDFKITKITLDDPNVLTYDFLHQLNTATVDYLKSSYGPTIVVSPLYDWALNMSQPFSDDYLISTVNFHSTYLLDSFYLENITVVNQLISDAGSMNVFFIHNKTESIDSSNFNIAISKSSEISNPTSIHEFLHYYLLLNRSGYTKYVNNFLNLAIIFGGIALLIHLYLSIANLHRLYSSGGILFGWIIEVLLASSCASNLARWWNGDSIWEQVYQPSSFFTKSIALMTIMFISSRNLIRVIQELSDCKKSYSTTEDSKLFQTKLYKFYIGMSNSSDANYDKIDFMVKLVRLVYSEFDCALKIPKVTKILVLDLFSFRLVELLSIVVIKYYFKGEFSKMLVTKMKRYFAVLFTGLISDHLLQLTFLISVILIDNHRVDVSKILDDDPALSKNDINYISYLFLKTKPAPGSFRHKLGTTMTFARFPTSFKSWMIALPCVHLTNCFVLLMNWSIYIPYNLFQEDTVISKLDIKSVKYDSFYYLEYVLSLSFYIALIIIIFQLSNYKVNVDDSTDIELNDVKEFKSVDLINRHDLDVVKLRSNNSSFLISIGLDHKILVWSPLSATSPSQFSGPSHRTQSSISSMAPFVTAPDEPIDLSSSIQINNKNVEFWPINYVNISTDGAFIILINYKFNLIKCYSRTLLKFVWTSLIDEDIKFSSDKILETFFRERTSPGFLKMKQMKKARRNSDISMNGNYPRLDSSALSKLDFVMVLETGKTVTYSCEDGTLKSSSSILEDVYDEEELNPTPSHDVSANSNSSQVQSLRLIAAKKLITPRVNDRIICQVNNGDLVVAVAVNNKWRCNILETRDDNYNKGFGFENFAHVPPATTASMARSNPKVIGGMTPYQETHNFKTANKTFLRSQPMIAAEGATGRTSHPTNSAFEVNKPLIVTIEFVGMIIRVNNLVAELVDVQTGIILHKVNVGHFKTSTFKVAHSEPTHCKFCGCVSLRSLSIVYEDFDSNTLIVHTFKIESNRSKKNICLRVERDPREIRCSGFNNAVEEQFWYDNVANWDVTDINIIIGIKKAGRSQDSVRTDCSDNCQDVKSSSSKLSSLRRRNVPYGTKPQTHSTPFPKWEGFIVSLYDGNMAYYDIPNLSSSLVSNKINCVEKFGFKSVAVTFGNCIKILYLGNDKLIENNLYFNDLNKNKAINNELLFINKRRKK